MIETIMLIVVIFVLSGVFWYSFFYQKEKKDAWNCYNFDFVHWLSLYNGIIKYDSKYEKYADYIL